MSGTEISLKTKDGTFKGYLASPSSRAGGGVVVIQEIFGINPWIRQICDWYATQGYFALAPDLFWRLQPGVQLDATVPDEFQQGVNYMMKLNMDMAVEDIQVAIDALRETPGCTGNVGTTGFCMGGLLCYLSACRTDGQAHASYYPGGIDQKLHEAKNIKTPTVFHLAGNDSYIPPHTQAAVRDQFAGNKLVQVYVYDGVDHGFCRETDPRHYAPHAAKLAHERTLELFRNSIA